jgi:hypothetical protein
MLDPSDLPLPSSQIVAERTHLAIPSLPSWIEPTVEFLRQKAVMGGACQETRSGKLLVALHEAITNAMVHGNLEVGSELKEQGNSAFAQLLAQRASDPHLASRKVDIVVDFDGDACRWIITDEGRGFDVDGVLARCLSDDPEILLSSGRGILMMKSFLDDVRFALGGRRVILSMERNSGAERRRDERLQFAAPFQVTPIGPDGEPDWARAYEAVSRNLSEGGVSLLQQQLANSGKVLIGVPTAHGLVHIPAKVKHARPLGASGMELGCQFIEEPPSASSPPAAPAAISPQLAEVQQAVLAILETYQSNQVPTHERREYLRVVFNERVAIQMEGRPEPIVGYARDLSKGGVALIAEQPLPGEVTITFARTAEREDLKVRCQVVRCSRIQEGFYDIGASFLRLAPTSGA